MSNLVADVIIDNRTANTDRPYTYLIKEEFKDYVEVGMRVLVPFGNGNRFIKGIIINIKKESKSEIKLKYIHEILDNESIISNNILKLALWMKDYYLCSYLDALRTVMPPGNFKEVKTYLYLNQVDKYLSDNEKNIVEYLKNKNKCTLKKLKDDIEIKNINKHIKSLKQKKIISTRLEINEKVKKKYKKYIKLNCKNMCLSDIIKSVGERAYKQIEIIKYLYNTKIVLLKKLLEQTSSTYNTISTLEKKGIIKIVEKEVLRNPIPENISYYKKFKLTSEQQNCVNAIIKNIKEKKNNKFLIHGVTGSGKTEIYLQLIEKVIQTNKQVIVLVPEISLTPQTVERFVGRFGDNVAILHSKLSAGERFDEWRKIKESKVNIVIGARSAIFAPFDNLGLVVIDEEHENSYKSSMNPKYNTLEVAEKRCEIENAYLILGTATPSIETYNRTKKKEMKLLTLSHRINKKQLPNMKIIDMRDELDKGNKSIFSLELFKAIKRNLENKKQTILFLNRRGYSTFVSCRKCGYVMKCENCDISLTYHIFDNKLKCHYCGKTINPPKICPECKSKYIKYFGIGTQKVETLIKRYFPTARVARMDVDTTIRKGSYSKILNKVKSGQIDILIGTQMISKGLDFPLVTLVGIIAADTSLNLPDYRAAERTFQLLTQVGGRAGRGRFEGKVIVQTYNPNHYSIQLAKNHDYINFYNKEILVRKEFEYPPFVELINIVLSGVNEKKVSWVCKDIYDKIISKLIKLNKQYIKDKILGPNPAPLVKIRNNYRWQIIIKSNKQDLNLLKSIIKEVFLDKIKNKKYNDIKFNVDVNPKSII